MKTPGKLNISPPGRDETPQLRNVVSPANSSPG